MFIYYTMAGTEISLSMAQLDILFFPQTLSPAILNIAFFPAIFKVLLLAIVHHSLRKMV